MPIRRKRGADRRKYKENLKSPLTYVEILDKAHGSPLAEMSELSFSLKGTEKPNRRKYFASLLPSHIKGKFRYVQTKDGRVWRVFAQDRRQAPKDRREAERREKTRRESDRKKTK